VIKSEPRVITTLITSDENEPPFRVTDLKQWAYCKRILYYHLCLPKVRPITFKMEEGKEEGKKEEAREKRRSLHLYGLEEGRKEFNVSVSSRKYGLRGKVDLVIWKSDEVIPVDYKFSLKGNREHFQLRLSNNPTILNRLPVPKSFSQKGIGFYGRSHRSFDFQGLARRSYSVAFHHPRARGPRISPAYGCSTCHRPPLSASVHRQQLAGLIPGDLSDVPRHPY